MKSENMKKKNIGGEWVSYESKIWDLSAESREKSQSTKKDRDREKERRNGKQKRSIGNRMEGRTKEGEGI